MNRLTPAIGVFAALLLFAPALLKAQTCASPEAGDPLRLTLTGQERTVEGRLVSLNADQVAFSAKGRGLTYPISEIGSMELYCRTLEPGPRLTSRGKNVGGIVGALAGAAAGLLTPVDDSDPSQASVRGLAVLGGAGIGLVAGGLIGAAIGHSMRATRSWVSVDSGQHSERPNIGIRVAPGPAGIWRRGLTIPVGR